MVIKEVFCLLLHMLKANIFGSRRGWQAESMLNRTALLRSLALLTRYLCSKDIYRNAEGHISYTHLL